MNVSVTARCVACHAEREVRAGEVAEGDVPYGINHAEGCTAAAWLPGTANSQSRPEQ